MAICEKCGGDRPPCEGSAERCVCEPQQQPVDAEEIWTALYELGEKPGTYWEAVQLALWLKRERDEARLVAREYRERWIGNADYDVGNDREDTTEHPWLLEAPPCSG